MTFKRHKIREVAFQTLFAMASDPEVDREQLYKELLPLAPQEEVPAYLEELVTGVSEHQAEFDQEIEGSLAGGLEPFTGGKAELNHPTLGPLRNEVR